METPITVIVSAYNEGDRLPTTLRALADAFPAAAVLVADDGSTDRTAHVALQAGAELVRSPTVIGKGGATTAAAERALTRPGDAPDPVVVLCDGDLGESARALPALVAAVSAGDCDLAIAAFTRKVGGGFGFAVSFSRWATRRLGGVELRAPISGQRALRADVLARLLPFAARFGMETAMNIDAARAGYRIAEVDLDLSHRATGKTLRGFLHRARQLADFALVYIERR